ARPAPGDREPEAAPRPHPQDDPGLSPAAGEQHGVRVPAVAPGTKEERAMRLGEDVLLLPVTELSARIKSRRLSPVELTEAYLDRIRLHAGSLNTFARVTAELALEQARAAEAEI